MQIKGSTYRSIKHCAKTVYTKEGLTAFYASYPTTLFMSIPFAAIQIAAYDSLSRVIRPRKAPPGNHIPTHLIAGGMAGALAAGLTTPLDCIKTVLQTRGTATDAEIRSVKGIAKAAMIIKRRYGLRGFFRGSWPRIITATPSTAICWWETHVHFPDLLCPTDSPTGAVTNWPKTTSSSTPMTHPTTHSAADMLIHPVSAILPPSIHCIFVKAFADHDILTDLLSRSWRWKGSKACRL